MRERNGSSAARRGGRRARRARLLVLAAGLALAGCNGLATNPSAFSQLPRGTPVEPEPGEKFLLRYLRDPAETERLYVEFDRHSTSLIRDEQTVRQRQTDDEAFTAVVFSYTTGQTPTGCDRLYLICNELTYRLNRPGERRTNVSQRQPSLSPNFGREYHGAPLIYYPVDARGQIAVLDAPGMSETTRLPWHYLYEESLGYLFPILPEPALAVGETWSTLVPVVVGAQHYDRNEFMVDVRARLEGLEELPEPGGAPGATCRAARIAYKWTGEFDTRQYPDRFKLEEMNRYREHFHVSGAGELLFDLRRGRLLAKQDRMTITSEVRILQETPPEKRGGERRVFWLANEGTHEFNFFARRLAPGEKLPGGAAVSPPVRPRPPIRQPSIAPRSRAWFTEPPETAEPSPTGPPEPLLPEESPPPPAETPPPAGR